CPSIQFSGSGFGQNGSTLNSGTPSASAGLLLNTVTSRPAAISEYGFFIVLVPLPKNLRPWSSTLELALDALIEFCDVDHDALVRAVADELLLVARLDAEIDGSSFHPRHFRSGGDPHADGRGGDVAHIQVGAEALIARRKQVLYGGQRGRLDQVDHHRRGKHPHFAAADARRRVLFSNDDGRASAQPSDNFALLHAQHGNRTMQPYA